MIIVIIMIDFWDIFTDFSLLHRYRESCKESLCVCVCAGHYTHTHTPILLDTQISNSPLSDLLSGHTDRH